MSSSSAEEQFAESPDRLTLCASSGGESMSEGQTIGGLISAGVLTLGDGYRTKKAELGDFGFRIIRVADVKGGNVSLESPDFVRNEFARPIGAKEARAGDVLLTTKGTVGRVAIMPEMTGRAVYSPQLCWFRFNDTDVVSARYFNYWLQSDQFLAQSSYLQGNTDMAPYISLSDLRDARIDLPGRTEQQAIAEVLGALDDKIAANTGFATTAELLLRAEIDAQWLGQSDRSATLADFVDLNPSTATPKNEEAIYVDMKKLPEAGWSIDEFERRPAKGGARFENGDTLLARITPCLENRKTGFVDALPEGETAIGSTEFIVIRTRRELADPVGFFLATESRFREFAIQHMVGTSGRQRVAARDLGAFEMPVPDVSWLRDFGERSSSLFALVAAHSIENSTLAATRDALLPQLMSGKLHVRDAEKIVDAAT